MDKRPWWELKPLDPWWKAILAVFVIMGMIVFAIFRAMFSCAWISITEFMAAPFEWKFVKYLDGQEERARYSRWFRNCRCGGWMLYKGPFGITRVTRSACRSK
jgi:hypothetical protein